MCALALASCCLYGQLAIALAIQNEVLVRPLGRARPRAVGTDFPLAVLRADGVKACEATPPDTEFPLGDMGTCAMHLFDTKKNRAGLFLVSFHLST